MKIDQGVDIWVEFHSPAADYVARHYLETARSQSVVRGIPLPPKFHLLSYKHSGVQSTEDRASIDLRVANGGSTIGDAELEIIRQHIQYHYLEAEAEAMNRSTARAGNKIAQVERRVEIGFIRRPVTV